LIQKIIELSVRKPWMVLITIIIWIGFGIWGILGIHVDAVPDITNNQVQVVTVSPAASAEEVERFITYPLELTLGHIPKVTDIRSISRFGLSVVTLIFDEDVPQEKARFWVQERITEAAHQIPANYGTPSMMPVTTGLGEIYQYTLQVDSQYRNRYTAQDLRTIQDWHIKRRLTGIDGIVEVSSFGGFMKEYEIAFDPNKMQSLDVSMEELQGALEQANQSEGGSYIEHGDRSWYLRSPGLLKTLDEVAQLPIATRGLIPVRVIDVADVRFGHAPRFGALTQDGLGEAVGGITLMLKGANASKTIDLVEKRMKEIQTELPRGVRIKPFLNRARLVSKNIGTVKNNLIEGGIIVLLVLILFLGNLRAGLAVASIIPLSLLFALAGMRIMDVSANLMSLGAIDFGIVVDGAVVVIEAILHVMLFRSIKDEIEGETVGKTIIGTSKKIIPSVLFGVLIIWVVFLPILSLEGIEGKMFRPMAITMMLALLGSLILTTWYLPALSSLLFKSGKIKTWNWSDKMMSIIEKVYQPWLHKTLAHPKWVITLGITLLIATGLGFSYMGGEFIPTLEEGDLAMQMSVPPGTSLQQVVQTSTKVEQLLMSHFPEVEHVVSKIGTGEVPTDPMAVEDADIMIILKDKHEWVSANNREELAQKMKHVLSVFAGVSFEFSQPIQLRFNELMTGSKADIAVKIYGEDPKKLESLANQLVELIKPIEGVGDVKAERTNGLPQKWIQTDPEKLAFWGISQGQVNKAIKTAFAGTELSPVYEGEKRFSWVIRMNPEQKSDFAWRNIPLRNDRGFLVPLSTVADEKEEIGPILITRENTRKRVAIGINVRGTDVAKLVERIQNKVNGNIHLPSGYNMVYGGQFENLQAASKRLTIVVPIALILILGLLFLAFQKIRPALLVFSAVPLSAIGGVAALWIRGMPFSISAGVGFIALFGVAVLNGIVLISRVLELQKNGDRVQHAIRDAAHSRLRPVLMTALVASLGFLPMALSTSAGAEVQKPLATVVIGGLISATLLTLLVLPVLMSKILKDEHE
jgi:cobalt-zinc-cadmium resistance protein CzcA